MADKDKDKNNQLNLGCLEEDDEFEEFPVEGLYFIRSIPSEKHFIRSIYPRLFFTTFC